MSTMKEDDNTVEDKSASISPEKFQLDENRIESKEKVKMEIKNRLNLLALLGSTLALVLLGGLFYNTGVLYVALLKHFGVNRGIAAWSGSLQMAMTFGAGPFAAALANQFSCHVAVITGGMLATLGLIISSFASNIYFFIASYGFITGIGFGLVYTPAVLLMGRLFTTRKGLATGIALSGMSCGWLLYPFIMRALLDNGGWQVCLRVLASMTFGICIAGVCMIPAERNKLVTPGKKLLHLEVLRKANVILLCFAMLAYLFGLSVVMVHAPALSVTLGFSVQQGSFLATIMGVSNLLGRILFGVIADFKKCNILIVDVIANIFTGLPVMFYMSANSYVMLATLMGTYGLFGAAFPTYVPLMVLQFVGVDKSVSGKGIVMFAGLFGVLFGGPTAGWLFDATQNYDISFLFGGSLTILSSAFIFVIWNIQFCSKEKGTEESTVNEHKQEGENESNDTGSHQS